MWLSTQQNNYSKKIKIMKNEDIQKKWIEFINDDKYKKYFMSNEEIWKKSLNDAKNYIINNNNIRPLNNNEDKNIRKIADFLSHQQSKYDKKIKIMKNEDIRKLWIEFVNDEKYKKIKKCENINK